MARAVLPKLQPQRLGRVRRRGQSWVARFQMSGQDICGPPRSVREVAEADRAVIAAAVSDATPGDSNPAKEARAVAQRLREEAEARRAATVEAAREARAELEKAEHALAKVVQKVRPWSRLYKHPYLADAGVRVRFHRCSSRVRYEHASLGALTETTRASNKHAGQDPCLVFDDLGLVVALGPYAFGQEGSRRCFLQHLEQNAHADAEVAGTLTSAVVTRAQTMPVIDDGQWFALQRVRDDVERDLAKPIFQQSPVELHQTAVLLAVELLVLAQRHEGATASSEGGVVANRHPCFSSACHDSEPSSGEVTGEVSDGDRGWDDFEASISAGSPIELLTGSTCADLTCAACNDIYAEGHAELRRLCLCSAPPLRVKWNKGDLFAAATAVPWHRQLVASPAWGRVSESQTATAFTAALAEALASLTESLKIVNLTRAEPAKARGKGSLSRDTAVPVCSCVGGATCPLALICNPALAAQTGCDHPLLRRREEEQARRRAWPLRGPLLMPRSMIEPFIDVAPSAVALHDYPGGVYRPHVASTLRSSGLTKQELEQWDADRDLVIALLAARHRAPASTEHVSWRSGIEWCEQWLKWDAADTSLLAATGVW